jgi:hypothetical protein
MRLGLAAALLLALGCNGGNRDGSGTGTSNGSGGATSSGCATDADCRNSGEVCFYPGQPNCPVDFSCSPEYCATDEWCSPADPAFPICGDSECRPHCVDDGGCRSGAETCSAASGTCVPIPCDGGFACASHETCVPGGPVHGCVRDACAGDADCAGGFCVESKCYDDPGRCGYEARN